MSRVGFLAPMSVKKLQLCLGGVPQSRLPSGRYAAVALPDSVCFAETADGMPYVDVSLRVVRGRYTGVVLLWRGGLTRGASPRTARALKAMGSSGVGAWDGRRDSLAEGLGFLRECEVEVESIECDEREAPGRWRTFVVAVAAGSAK